MEKEIINRISKSKLVSIDIDEILRDFEVVTFDLKKYLKNDLVLIEKDFRDVMKKHKWKQYVGKKISIICSNSAIVPDWAFMLVSSYLKKNKIDNYIADEDQIKNIVLFESLNNLDLSLYINKVIVIKGCSKRNIPKYAYSILIDRLQPIAKKIMFGEACSSVPIYKKPIS
tara:strand:- start:88 stop:600 length:513 start_codon:yes stop_codon:yes gene_type:complete